MHQVSPSWKIRNIALLTKDISKYKKNAVYETRILCVATHLFIVLVRFINKEINTQKRTLKVSGQESLETMRTIYNYKKTPLNIHAAIDYWKFYMFSTWLSKQQQTTWRREPKNKHCLNVMSKNKNYACQSAYKPDKNNIEKYKKNDCLMCFCYRKRIESLERYLSDTPTVEEHQHTVKNISFRNFVT